MPKPVRSQQRVIAIDIARALAGMIMIQGHAFDAWSTASAKATDAYAFTRLLGTFPLPSFFLLAGAAVALRRWSALSRNEDLRAVSRRLVRRGLQVTVWGYAVSLAFALLDGGLTFDTVLRADVLHAIGLSIAALGSLVYTRRFALALVLLGVTSTLLAPWVSPWSTTLQLFGLEYGVALFFDVEGITRVPIFPLLAWACAGTWLTTQLLSSGSELVSRKLAPHVLASRAPLVLGLGLFCWTLGAFFTDAALSWKPGALSRQHWAVVPNVVDLLGRSLVLFSLGLYLGTRVRGKALSLALLFGQHSLFIYILHIPFCYGRFGAVLRGQLSMSQGLLGVSLLLALCAGCASAKARFRGRARTSVKPALVAASHSAQSQG